MPVSSTASGSARHDGDAEGRRARRERRGRRGELGQRATADRKAAHRGDCSVHDVQVLTAHVEPGVERPYPGPLLNGVLVSNCNEPFEKIW